MRKMVHRMITSDDVCMALIYQWITFIVEWSPETFRHVDDGVCMSFSVSANILFEGIKVETLLYV